MNAASLSPRDVFVPEERAIAMIESCAMQIAQAATIADVKRVISQADAIAAVVRKINASHAVRKSALALQLDAEIQLGVLTRAIPQGSTGRAAAGSPGQATKSKVLKEHGLHSQRISVAEKLAAMPREQVMAAASASKTGTITGVALHLGLKKPYVAPSASFRKIAMNAIGLLVTCQTANRVPRCDEVDALRDSFTNADVVVS